MFFLLLLKENYEGYFRILLGLLTFVKMFNKIIIFNGRAIIQCIISFILSSTTLTMGQNEWVQLHDDPEFTISGVAQFNNGYIVVHDNKRKDQPRVSFINKNNEIKQITWPKNKLPFDLEGVGRLPGFEDQFIMMESSGICYRVFIEPIHYSITIINVFKLPNIKNYMNLEGLSIFEVDSKYIIVYGDRGSMIRQSVLLIARYDPSIDFVSDIETYTINLPEPKQHKRNIADLTIDDRNILWTSATSDPGDNGPFETMLYEIGEFNLAGDFTPYKIDKPLFSFPGQKVEAMVFEEPYIILMTDNENFGATFHNIDVSLLK